MIEKIISSGSETSMPINAAKEKAAPATAAPFFLLLSPAAIPT